MIKRVKKREIPKTTWLGGEDCKDRARLTKSKTMEMRRKLVIKINKLGARERTVNNSRIWREKATSLPVVGLRTETLTKGTTGFAGGVGI